MALILSEHGGAGVLKKYLLENLDKGFIETIKHLTRLPVLFGQEA